MTQPKPDRIAILEAKKQRIEAQLAQHKTRQLRQDKKRADRLKVLLGAFLLSEVEHNVKLRSYVRRHLLDFHHRKRYQDFLGEFLGTLPTDE